MNGLNLVYRQHSHDFELGTRATPVAKKSGGGPLQSKINTISLYVPCGVRLEIFSISASSTFLYLGSFHWQVPSIIATPISSVFSVGSRIQPVSKQLEIIRGPYNCTIQDGAKSGILRVIIGSKLQAPSLRIYALRVIHVRSRMG
jgi:hypothetical protein